MTVQEKDSEYTNILGIRRTKEKRYRKHSKPPVESIPEEMKRHALQVLDEVINLTNKSQFSQRNVTTTSNTIKQKRVLKPGMANNPLDRLRQQQRTQLDNLKMKQSNDRMRLKNQNKQNNTGTQNK